MRKLICMVTGKHGRACDIFELETGHQIHVHWCPRCDLVYRTIVVPPPDAREQTDDPAMGTQTH